MTMPSSGDFALGSTAAEREVCQIIESNRKLREKNRKLLAENDTLTGRVQQLEEDIQRMEREIHGRDLGDEHVEKSPFPVSMNNCTEGVHWIGCGCNSTTPPAPYYEVPKPPAKESWWRRLVEWFWRLFE